MKRLEAQQEKRKAAPVISDIEQVIVNKHPDLQQRDINAHRIMADIARPDIEPEGQIIRVDIDLVYAEEQVRPEEDFDEEVIDGMSDTYDSLGMLTPPRCFPRDRRGYRIWMGETRVRTAKKRGDKQIDIYVGKPPKDDKDRIIGQLIENLQQSGLKPLATAKAFRELKQTHGMTGEQIAKTMGKPTSFVSKHLRLINAPENITALLRDKVTSDVDLAYTLIQVCEKAPEEAEKLIAIARDTGISRAQVKNVLDTIKQKESDNISHAKSQLKSSASKPKARKPATADAWYVVVEFEDQEGFILTNKAPEKDGSIWIKVDIGEMCVEPALLRIKGLKSAQ
ncbi:ParB/RepB/Spo0J family partition protein [Vagococcus sp. WN89Y]|uniref:ParB/RepB/Spo0J family partition protein n=1 Tax=Vagococcus sp. WN89Y TaxID=3457258 RepID=UPI003FCE29CD